MAHQDAVEENESDNVEVVHNGTVAEGQTEVLPYLKLQPSMLLHNFENQDTITHILTKYPSAFHLTAYLY